MDNVRLFDTEHGFQRVQLLKPQLYSSQSSDSNRSYDELIDFLVENVTVPSVDTTYWCSLHRLPDKFKSKHHITQYEAIVSESSKHLVHHMELFHCEIEPELSLSSWNGSCDDVTMPKPLKACKKVVAAWAFGAAVSFDCNPHSLSSSYSPNFLLEANDLSRTSRFSDRW